MKPHFRACWCPSQEEHYQAICPKTGRRKEAKLEKMHFLEGAKRESIKKQLFHWKKRCTSLRDLYKHFRTEMRTEKTKARMI